MVSVNPGLDGLKHNITGGSISAQGQNLQKQAGILGLPTHTSIGYWIPFHCARELATKFCHPIAGALIPIFGPTFPRDCLHPSSPEFDDMVISQETIRAAELDTRMFFKIQQRTRMPARSPAITSHPHTPYEPARESSEERSRVEDRWSEPPSTSLERGPFTSYNSRCPSRPGTQDGSSLMVDRATVRSRPNLSQSYNAYPQDNTLPPLNIGISLPPLRNHLQEMALQSMDAVSSMVRPRSRDLSAIDPQLLGVEDEVSSFHGENISSFDQWDGRN